MRSSNWLPWTCCGPVLILVVGGGIMAFKGHREFVTVQNNLDARWAVLSEAYRQRVSLVTEVQPKLTTGPKINEVILTELTQALDKIKVLPIESAHAPSDMRQFQQYLEAQNALSKVLGHVAMQIMREPALGADPDLRLLPSKIMQIQSQIALAQNRFDQGVAVYNSEIRRFPVSIEATLRGIQPRKSFQL